MTNAYGTLSPQYSNSIYTYQQQTNKKNNTASSVIAMSGVGFAGGGTVAYFKNRYPVKDGLVADEFASSALNKYIDKGYAIEGKKFFKELKNVMKKLDKIKTPEKLKALLNKNKEVKQKVYNAIPFDTITETLDKSNLKNIINSLKARLQAERMHGVANMKEIILKYWDEGAKKFVLPANAKDKKILKVLKSTGNSVKLKQILKYGGITAGIFGGLTLGYKLFTSRAVPRQPVLNNQQYFVPYQ